MSTEPKAIRAADAKKQVIAMSAPVSITAAKEEDGKKSPPKFDAVFYTGGALELNGWDLPVVVDLSGLDRGNVLVANLDHDRTKRVGNFDVTNDGKQLTAHGSATAKTAARDEVVGSAEEGYQWQASLEVTPRQLEEVKAGKKVTVNGQEFTGPLYVTRKGTLKGFAFVSHGADDNTTVSIAAIAANHKEHEMDAKLRAWIEDMLPGTDVDHLSAETLEKLEADFKGQSKNSKPKPKTRFKDIEAEAERVEQITEYAEQLCERRKYDREYISAVKELTEQAIEAGWPLDKFRLELLEASVPLANPPSIHSTRDRAISNRVLEAAIAEAGRLPEKDQHGRTYFSDQEMQLAHDRFKGRIGLKEIFLLCAQANGYRSSSLDVTIEAHNAAFGLMHPSRIQGTGFSALDISTILSNTANKFVMRGWNMVDQTPLRISKIQNVKDFKTITTVSLTDSVRYEQLGPAGEIKHGTLGELSYTNKADTYAKMLAITRTDIINDDLGALTDVPMKLGNGAMKLLNHIFWTEFLAGVSTSFFASGNSNINTAVADMTIGGLAATETIFMNQTNPDGTPLGIQPAIILVPTALKATAVALMDPQSKLITGASATLSDVNVFAGRFRVESSPYISNSSYTGNTSTAWWMLADPNELPVIAIAALNGRVEPTVETADAAFNVLGVQMRGYSDVGVNFQEYRGGVHADGGSS